MALTKCTDCGKEISESAPLCPSCGKPSLKKRENRGWLKLLALVIALLIIGFVVLVAIVPDNNSTQDSKTSTEQQVDFSTIEKGVKDLTDVGFIMKLDPAYHEAFVSGVMWNNATYDEKRTLGFVLAHYCGYKTGTKRYWVDIKDNNSGKKLASWGAWGFKVD